MEHFAPRPADQVAGGDALGTARTLGPETPAGRGGGSGGCGGSERAVPCAHPDGRAAALEPHRTETNENQTETKVNKSETRTRTQKKPNPNQTPKQTQPQTIPPHRSLFPTNARLTYALQNDKRKRNHCDRDRGQTPGKLIQRRSGFLLRAPIKAPRNGSGVRRRDGRVGAGDAGPPAGCGRSALRCRGTARWSGRTGALRRLCGARPCRELPQPGRDPGPSVPRSAAPRGAATAPHRSAQPRAGSEAQGAPGVGARPDITVRTGLCGERKNKQTGKDGKRMENSRGSGRRLRYLPKEVVFAVKLAFSRKAFLCQIAFTFTALNTLHMPSPVQYIQQEPVQDWPFAACTVNHCLWLFLRVGYRRPRWQAKN